MKRKKQKRFWALLLTFVMVISCLAGCGEKESAETVTEKERGEEAVENSDTVEATHPVTTDPITISILTQRHTTATNNAEDIWFFQYLEYWLKETYGYNVTIDVQQTSEPDQQISLLLGTDTLPDMIWAIPLTPSNAVIYGDGQGMLLDWNAYLNEQYMPNASSILKSAERADALSASTSLNGAVYSLPYLSNRAWGNALSSLGGGQDRMFINTAWLEEFGLEMPTNLDEFYNMLRVFRDKKTLTSGETVIPVLSNNNAGFLERTLWLMMGYYGNMLSQYGTEIAVKDGTVTLPAYSEDYKMFIEIMKTMYAEGFLSQDHFSMDSTTMRGLSEAGVAGVVCDSTLGFVSDYMEWEALPWFKIGDTEEIFISASSDYETGRLWASADTEYPEVVALIADYLYSYEGATFYDYGPMQGQDPLNMLDGWYLDEEQNVTTKLVADGTIADIGDYCYQYIRSYDNVGYRKLSDDYVYKLAGVNKEFKEYKVLDTLTGEEFLAYEYDVYTDENAGGHWFLTNGAASRPYITRFFLPTVYMNEEDSLRAVELFSVINNHIITESAKFIAGNRPIEEIDAFHEELKGMGVEEYIDLYAEAYASYMDLYFK